MELPFSFYRIGKRDESLMTDHLINDTTPYPQQSIENPLIAHYQADSDGISISQGSLTES